MLTQIDWKRIPKRHENDKPEQNNNSQIKESKGGPKKLQSKATLSRTRSAKKNDFCFYGTNLASLSWSVLPSCSYCPINGLHIYQSTCACKFGTRVLPHHVMTQHSYVNTKNQNGKLKQSYENKNILRVPAYCLFLGSFLGSI